MNDKDQSYADLLFGVRRSVRYNSRRQAFFYAWDRTTSFLLLLLGSGEVWLVLKDFEFPAVTVGLAISAISGAKLVFAFGRKAGVHSQFVKDFTRLEKELRATSSQTTVKRVTVERLDLEATEPPVKHALNVICHNELAQATGLRERYKVTRLQKFTANYFCWAGQKWDHVPG